MRPFHLLLLLYGLLPLCYSGIQAEEFSITFKTGSHSIAVEAEEIRGRIWINGSKLARFFGAAPYSKNGIHVWEFSRHTVAINPRKSTYSVLRKGKKRWQESRFEKNAYLDRDHLMVLLDSLPDLMDRSFTYHYQKRVLTVDRSDGFLGRKDLREVKVGFVLKDRRVWISLKDLANALGVVVFSSQAGRFGVVLPDFSILELRPGDKDVTKRKQLFARLEDPPLLLSGSLHVTVESIGPLFSIDARWDSKSQSLILPARYGRMADIAISIPSKLRYIGYRPQPFRFRVEEFSAFYQNIEPTYPADHEELYESVKDFFTFEPIDPQGRGFERVSGHALLDLQSSPFGTPLTGRGSLEKVGSQGRVANGNIKMGFPWFQIQGAREYTTFNGLNNQFNLVDAVSVSHSNDHYGEGDKNPEVTTAFSYGELDFSVFLSTELFTQTVDFEQKYEMGSVELDMTFSRRHRASIKLEQYWFQNKPKTVSAVYNDQDFFDEIFGSSFTISVDPAEQEALSRSFLSDHHSTMILNLNYKTGSWFNVTGIAGLSNYKEGPGIKRQYGHDLLVQTNVGNSKNKVDLSYEKSSPHYRSIGSPLRYQDREIYRIGPTLSFARWWKVLGQYRREDIGVLQQSGIPPYSNIYAAATNLLSFKTKTIRATANQFRSGISGRRANGHLDYTHYFGPHSIDLGGSVGGFWNRAEEMIRRSYTGRTSFQWVKPSWKFSLGEEYTWHYYHAYRINRFESITSLSTQIHDIRAFLQYKKEPKYFLSNDRLYTGVVRLGHQVGQKKVFNLFYAVTSLHGGLKDPVVWRSGFEYVLDFY